MKTFLISYSFDGRETLLELKARDEAEAQARVKALSASMRLDGELVARGPAFGLKATQRVYRALGLL